MVVIVNLFNDDEDNDLLWVEDKLGLLVALVDREFAVEFLVLDLDLDRDCSLILAGDISIMNWGGLVYNVYIKDKDLNFLIRLLGEIFFFFALLLQLLLLINVTPSSSTTINTTAITTTTTTTKINLNVVRPYREIIQN